MHSVAAQNPKHELAPPLQGRRQNALWPLFLGHITRHTDPRRTHRHHISATACNIRKRSLIVKGAKCLDRQHANLRRAHASKPPFACVGVKYGPRLDPQHNLCIFRLPHADIDRRARRSIVSKSRRLCTTIWLPPLREDNGGFLTCPPLANGEPYPRTQSIYVGK